MLASYKITHSYQAGDRVYVETSSSVTMLYYAQNRGKFQCPCLWKKEYGIVLHTHGNYIFCKHEDDPYRISAFYFKDISLADDDD